MTKNSIMGKRVSDCPYCGCIDKHRILIDVIKNHTNIMNQNCRVLHFAPEETVKEVLLSNPEIEYISGDIAPGRADEIVDMTHMQFEDESFDYIIASMVLEHVNDEKLALAEIKRVLRKNGIAVVLVPVVYGVKCEEDRNISGDEERLRRYGQEDHVRLYGEDYEEHFKKLWDKGQSYVEIVSLEKSYSKKELKKNGIYKRMPVVLFHK